jgi:predicted AlkP superfamily phosphohydrolase/phosphomutase
VSSREKHPDVASAPGGPSTRPRLVVFGLDGAAWPLIDPLLEAGDLPALSALLEGGHRSPLRSVVPPLTAPAWQSMFTGLGPEQHGVFDMTVFDPALGRRRPPCYDDWQADTLWRRVAELGLRGGYIGIPFTYPPPDVEGWFISGVMGTPRYDEGMFRPAELLAEVTDVAGQYPLDALEKRDGRYPLRTLERQIEWLHAATMHLLTHHPVDVLVVVENYTDFVQHFFMTERVHEDAGQARDMIRLAYRAADRLLGDVRGLVGDDVPCALVSDHGFRELEGYVNATHLAIALSKSGAARERTSEIVFRALKSVWRATGKAALRAFGVNPAGVSQWGVRAMKRTGDEADAFVVGHYGSVWLTGDPAATTPEDIDRACQVLAELRDPERGGPLLDVRKGSEVYPGPHLDRAPHLVLRPVRDGLEFRRAAPSAPLLIDRAEAGRVGMERSTTDGTHAPEGIWAVSGSAAHVPAPTSLPDVLEALMALIGPRPAEAAACPCHCVPQEPRGYTADEEAAVLRQLQDLGYID